MESQVTHTKQARVMKRRVFFNGSSALSKGQGVCYQRALAGDGATSSDERRDKYVALPDNTNNLAFAGVAIQDYAASSTGQWIEIFEPGSVCPVLANPSALTIGQDQFVTCIAGGSNQGKFDNTTSAGLSGRGTARVLQTIAAAGLVLAELLDGEESGLIEYATPAAGANTFMTGGVTVLQAATLASNATYTLGNALRPGLKKVFIQAGTLTTSGVVVTVTSGQQHAATTALATLTFAAGAATKWAELEWTGIVWKVLGLSATSPAQA